MAIFKDPATKSIILMGVMMVLIFSAIMVIFVHWVSGDLMDHRSLFGWFSR